MRRLAVLGSAVVLALLAQVPAGRATGLAGPSVAVSSEDYVIGSWELYRARFVTEDGRVTDDDNGMISHSEGQGYGMLIATAADDRATFERLWAWTKRELMVRDDALAAWRWDPGATPHVTDRNDATDGDILIAWALLRASERWNVAAYRTQAKRIVDDVVDLATADSRYGRILLPGVDGFSGTAQPDGPVVNLSYWVLPAIAELEPISAKLASAKLIDSGLALIEASRFGPAGIPTDWIGLGGEGAPKPAANFPPQYAYNAVRIPLYRAWYSRDDALVASFADVWTENGTVRPKAIEVETGADAGAMAGPGYLALSDLMACSLHRTEAAEAAKRFEPTTYYPSTLHLLSLMALSERYPQCL
jgi:endoglucanase